MTEVVDLLLLDVAVQQKCGVLLLGLLLLVDALQVLDQVIDLRNIEELPYHIGRFDEAEREDVLLDGACEVSLRVQQVSMQSRYLGEQRFLAILIFSEPPGLVVERALEEGLNLEGVVLLGE